MAIPPKGRGSMKGHGSNAVKKSGKQPTKGGAYNPSVARQQRASKPR